MSYSVSLVSCHLSQFINLHQHKGWALNFLADSEGARKALHKSGFARTQISLKGENSRLTSLMTYRLFGKD